MVADVLEAFRRSKRQVYTCMKSLRIPGQTYFDVENLEDLCELQSGIIIMDEAQIGLSARSWSRTPERVLSALAQLRKNGLDLYVTTQHLDKVDVQLRQLVNEAVSCRMLGGRVLVNRAYDPNVRDARDRARALWWRVRSIDRRWFELYDTYEVMGSLRASGVAVAEWLERLRASSACADRAQRSIFDAPYVYWQGDRCVVECCEEAVSIYRWLYEKGLTDDRDDWRRAVAVEARRRRWLAFCGLPWEAVPCSCTFDHPWAEGGSPYVSLSRALAEEDVDPREASRAKPFRRRFAERTLDAGSGSTYTRGRTGTGAPGM
jgi:hypothetical protein